jgi:integrase
MPFTADWLQKQWKKGWKAAGMERVTLHDLRHCAAQWAMDEGADKRDIQKFLGHGTTRMTDRYVARKMRRDVATRVARPVPRVVGRLDQKAVTQLVAKVS